MDIKDFSQIKHFPGTTGNPFDLFLHGYAQVQKFPAPIYALILGFIALPAHFGNWPFFAFFWAILLVDWALLAALPMAGKSYGPAKPPALILAVMRFFPAFLPIPFAIAIQLLGTALVVYGFWIEPHTIRLTRQKLTSPNLHLDQPLRVLHIGDLHVERVTARERQLNRMIRELQPDLILFSGDFLNLSYLKDAAAWEAVRQVLSEWQAPLGVYAVTGSPAVDLPENFPKLLEGTPIRLLQDETVFLGNPGKQLRIVGLTCTHKPFEERPRLERLLSSTPDPFTILLYHSPDLAPDAAQLGVDLQLSGHTHGGQIRLPLIGALFTGSLYGRLFEAGRYQIDRMVLYISRGVGLEGAAAPRVRFLCPPEIILWELNGQGDG
jgi:uncharacterized protein